MSPTCAIGRFLGAAALVMVVGLRVSTAQGSGTIKGQVVDKVTGESLPGANILLVGSSTGASTDLDGRYILRLIPVGTWTLRFTYVGYTDTTVEVTVGDNETVEKNMKLLAHVIEGKEVVVTAQAQGQMQAINQQLASNKIVSIVSEARIQQLPDFNAAQAISRLPGVSALQSSGEASKIVVRGLAPQYNQVSVGGISLASTGSAQIGATSLPGLTSGAISNDRSVDLTMVTPYMLKAIQVYKSLTPDMNANAIGGSVNMELREAPSGEHWDALWQSGYTQKSNTYGNYRGIVSGSDRFFDDDLGVYVLGNIEQYDRNSDNMNAGYVTESSVIGESGYRPVLVNNVTLNRHVETRQRFGGNVILDYNLPYGSIKSMNMFSRLNSNSQDYNTTINYQADRVTKSLGFSYREGDQTTDLAVNSLDFTSDFGFISMELKAANTYSRNHLPLSPFYNFSQNNATSGFSVSDTNVTPDHLTPLVKYGSDTTTLLTSMNLFSSDYHENDQVYKADFKVPMTVESLVSGFFQFGGQIRHDLHANDQSTPYIQISGVSNSMNNIINKVRTGVSTLYPNLVYSSLTGQLEGSNFTTNDPSKLLNSFLSNRFGSMYWAVDPTKLNTMINYFHANSASFFDPNNPTGGGWYDGAYQELPNDYRYVENYYAGYFMSELDFGQDFMVVGGARYERVRGVYSAINMMDERNPLSQNYFPVTVYPENQYWLPMVQARYNIFDWSDVRYSYTQTLARPDYTQLSPHFNVSSDQNNVWSGNPNLKPAQAYNQDFVVTIHSNEVGLFSVGGFYKEINHFTFSTSYHLHSMLFYSQHGISGLDSVNTFAPIQPHDDANLYTFINSPYKAYVRGVEAEIQTRFWYLPSPFDGVVFGVNYTRISSSAQYPYFDEVPHGRTVQFIDSSRTARLVNQPNDILNTYFGYDNGGFSARISFVLQGNSITNIAAYPEGDGYSKDYYRWDASVREILPWLPGIQVYLDVTNINNESNISAQKSIDGFTNQQFYGLVADLGIRYTL
ncbi:MAG TPA: TonB-dependent receptor [Bacteroidota bacterium]|nr:TonB-dependent receptor [Bacteroidota bacterium]